MHRREDGSTRDTHDDQSGCSSGVSTETSGGQDEDDWVHDRLEEHDDDGEVDTGLAVNATDHDGDDGASSGVDTEEDWSSDEGEKGSSDESSDGEGDETVRKELRSLGVVDTGILSKEKEESTDGDLGTDIEELGDETRDGSVLLVEGLENLSVVTLSLGKSLSLGLEGLLGDFRQLGKSEEQGDNDTHSSDGKVHKSDRSEILAMLVREEVLGSNERTGERSDTVERLRELKSEVGDVVWWHNGNVRVGGDFERSKTASDDSGTDNETTEDCVWFTLGGEFGDGPEEDSTERVETKTHDDGKLVTSSSHDFTSDRGEGKVTNTKVSSLKTGGLSFRDTEDRTEVGVEDVEETVGETPEEEERGNEDESPEILSLDETMSDWVTTRTARDDCTTCHCVVRYGRVDSKCRSSEVVD